MQNAVPLSLDTDDEQPWLDCIGTASQVARIAGQEVRCLAPFSTRHQQLTLCHFCLGLSGKHICRLQNWGGQLSKQILIPEQLPDFLTTFPPLIQRIRETGAYDGSKHGEPNHCVRGRLHESAR